jgi:hypothetical protein
MEAPLMMIDDGPPGFGDENHFIRFQRDFYAHVWIPIAPVPRAVLALKKSFGEQVGGV